MSSEVSTVQSRALQEDDEQVSEDATLVRENLRDIVDKGKNALDQIYAVADQSGMPEAYEALAAMIKTMVKANSELMNLHKTKKSLAKKEGGKRVQNNLFVGSTAELQQMLEEIRKTKNE